MQFKSSQLERKQRDEKGEVHEYKDRLTRPVANKKAEDGAYTREDFQTTWEVSRWAEQLRKQCKDNLGNGQCV